MNQMLIVDGHEDLAWNIVAFGRDYTQSALWNRAREAGTRVPAEMGNTLLGKPEWLLGHVGVIFATLFVAPERHKVTGWDVDIFYRSAGEAFEKASTQLDVYQRLADEDEQFRLIGDKSDLKDVLASWRDEASLEDRVLGLVPLMEGADPVLEPEQVEEWFERGIRIIGLAWEATRYAGGTHEPGGLTQEGFELLEMMAGLGIMLDLSHLAEEAYYEAVNSFEGVLLASHSNPRRFCPTTRGLSDDMIRVLAERDGVMGVVPYNRFLDEGWVRGDRKDAVSLLRVVDAIDHVCQVTGSHRHVAIGTDFDGGFGMEHTPAEINTVDDLQKLVPLLAERGFTTAQSADIMGGNWLRSLQEGLPG